MTTYPTTGRPNGAAAPTVTPTPGGEDRRPMLAVVVASTRPGRAGRQIADWFTSQVRADGRFDVLLVDLAALQLPLFDEPHHPRLRQYTKEHTLQWSAMVDAADAFVFVTPEYNHGYPASLKNAIDYLHQEWQDKPAGFVSYGGVSAGTRAVQQLKQVLAVLKMMTVAEAVAIPFHTSRIDDTGALRADESMERSAVALVTELLRMDSALRPLRSVTR